MRIIFYTYCTWYIVIAMLMSFGDFESVLTAKIIGAISILSIGYISMSPMLIIMNPNIIKSHQSDSKYLNFCLAAGGLRIGFWAVSVIGVRDHLILLSLNAFGLAIFALLEGKYKRMSNEYFKH